MNKIPDIGEKPCISEQNRLHSFDFFIILQYEQGKNNNRNKSYSTNE